MFEMNRPTYSLALLLLASSAAAAQGTHHQSLAYGDRAMGMGGAFTGLADGAGASWYNPAGLAFMQGQSLSANLFLRAFEDFRMGEGELRLEATRRGTAPLFATGVTALGRRDENGDARHALGLTVLRPVQVRRQLAQVALAPVGAPSSASINRVQHTTLLGPSWGTRFGEHFAIGATLLGSITKFDHRESLLHQDEAVAAELRNTRLEMLSSRFVLRTALLYRGPRFRFGLLVQPPSVGARPRAALSEQRGLPGEAPTFREREEVGASVRAPALARMGVSYRFRRGVTLSADVQGVAPVRSRRFVNAPAPGEESPEEPAVGAYVDLDTRREPILNGAAGCEIPIRRFTLRFGVFTDLSTARRIPASAERYAEPRIPSVGGAGSLGFHAGAFDMTLGLAGVAGRGSALVFDPRAGLSDPSYERANARRRYVYFFISGRMAPRDDEEGDEEPEGGET